MADEPLHALVVDDDPMSRELTLHSLHSEGFECRSAADGQEAHELLEAIPFDLVVTDLRMPRRHGHALAVELLARQDRPAVVILTGLAELKLARDLLARGVDDMLFKPIDGHLFAIKMAALARRRRQFVRGSASMPSQDGF